MMKKVSFYLLGYFFTLMMFSSCNYDYIQPEPVIIPTDSISFATDVVPMFSKGCVTCHGKGAVPPDLTPSGAYQSITSLGLINKTDPAQSIFYLKITTGSMASQGSLSANDKALFLAWIKQGAKNN
jgi:hypothetical protein